MNSTEPPPERSQVGHPNIKSIGLVEKSSNGGVESHALTTVFSGMAVNFILGTLKLMVWLLSTHKSAALFSEVLHSFGDGLNSIILVVAAVRGGRKPDRTHPFGYGLESNFWSLFASIVLFVIASWAFMEGLTRFGHPYVPEDTFWPVVVLVVSMVFELFAIWLASRGVLAELNVEANFFTMIPKGYYYAHQAKVPTTRFVFFEDTLAFLGAFVACLTIFGSQYFVVWGWLRPEQAHYPDAIASILISFMLLALSLHLFLDNKSVLLGSSASAKEEEAIKNTVLSIHGVSQIHDIKTINKGHSGLVIHLTVEVEPETPVKDVDDLTDHIKAKLSERFPNVFQEQVFIEVLADETEVEWSAKFEALVEEGRREGVLKPRDEHLLRRAYDFTELVVRDVMVPRTDVDFVNLETSLEELAEQMIETGHTRYPVFRENVDDLMGIVHSRDVFMQWRLGRTDISLAEIIREIDIYPENKPVSDLLEEFKRKKLRMAAVADEHGGFAGIVTIEDLMEEIVGEIWDEHEDEELMLQFLSPYRILVSGKYNIEDINDQLDLMIPNDEFLTIGGFVFGRLGREPIKEDRVGFEDLTLTVDQVDGPRIVTLIIESPHPFEDKRTALEREKSRTYGG